MPSSTTHAFFDDEDPTLEPRDDVLDVVGHTRHGLAQHDQLLLRGNGAGDIGGHLHAAGDLPVLPHQRRGLHGHLNQCAVVGPHHLFALVHLAVLEGPGHRAVETDLRASLVGGEAVLAEAVAESFTKRPIDLADAKVAVLDGDCAGNEIEQLFAGQRRVFQLAGSCFIGLVRLVHLGPFLSRRPSTVPIRAPVPGACPARVASRQRLPDGAPARSPGRRTTGTGSDR